MIRDIIKNKIDIKGGYKKPKVSDILLCQMVLFPYYLGLYVAWYVAWVYRFTICREEYGDEEKLYIIRCVGAESPGPGVPVRFSPRPCPFSGAT